MVASSSTLAERFAAPPPPLMDGRWRLVRLTWKDAEAMMRLGIVPEDASTELLNGWIVLKDRSALGQDPTMIGRNHTRSVERLSDLRARINSPSRHVQSQQPLACSDTHVPEPDFMVLRGRLEDYSDLPRASDAYCVVEVADSSYERDAGEKLVGYARAGIVQYVILNLRNQTAEIYMQPDISAGTYPPAVIISGGQMLALRISETESLDVPLDQIFAG